MGEAPPGEPRFGLFVLSRFRRGGGLGGEAFGGEGEGLRAKGVSLLREAAQRAWAAGDAKERNLVLEDVAKVMALYDAAEAAHHHLAAAERMARSITERPDQATHSSRAVLF